MSVGMTSVIHGRLKSAPQSPTGHSIGKLTCVGMTSVIHAGRFVRWQILRLLSVQVMALQQMMRGIHF